MTEYEYQIAVLEATLVPMTYHHSLWAYLTQAFSGEAK